MRSFAGALACTGAVIGAGFASGREIVAFFSRYGNAGWWLMALAAAAMAGLCGLVLRSAACSGAACWCDLYEENSVWIQRGAKLCTLLLLIVTGGAMIAASGQMIALIWAHEWAYALGAAVTFAAAWLMSCRGMRPMSWLSGLLTVMLLLSVFAASFTEPSVGVKVEKAWTWSSQLAAGVRAIAYASMNLTLAIGVVCRSAQPVKAANRRTALWFGGMMLVLMALSHRLYSRHPEWLNEGFPLVRLLASFGRNGFLLSVMLVYLSVLTSLTAVIYALQCAMDGLAAPQVWRAAVVLLPVGISCLGFSQIVDRLYAPSGLLCLALVFYPLLRRRSA